MPELIQRLLAATALLIWTPVLLLAMAAIWLTDGRPIFFVQQRAGIKRKPIDVLKLRTMRDDQITPIGRILRKTGIDEIPQLINIVKGDMNLVGPRPLTEYDIERLGWNGSYYLRRWNSKPGLTGLGQIFAGHSARMSWQMDSLYSQRRNTWFDCWIMAVTVPMSVLGKYRVRAWLRG